MKRALSLALAVLALPLGGTVIAQEISEQAAAGGARQDDLLPRITPAAEAHFQAARAAAGSDFPGPLQLCNSARPAGAKWERPAGRAVGPTNAELLRMGKTRAEFVAGGGVNHPAPPPTRIFDNLYYLGIEDVTAWAITTPDGIILVDTLNNGREWTERIEPAMRKIGLDPARIKYIIVTHGHGDHFGGAAYLAKTYGAHVLMSDIDWRIAPDMVDKPFFDAPPPRDMTIRDGQVLSLGGENVRMFVTPGHTRGTVSLLIPVTDGGRKHVAALWGGTGFNFPHTPDRFKIYSDSALRMMREARAVGADVMLSPHPDFDGSPDKIARLATRGAGDSHPYVVGPDGVGRLFSALSHCALAYSAQMRPK